MGDLRPKWLLLGFLVGCSSSPSNSSGIAPGSWGAEFAAAECARIFGCCNAAEAAQMGYSDQAQCTSTNASKEQMALDEVLSTGMVRYDAASALSCVNDVAAASCSEFFSDLGRPTVPSSCDNVTTGTGQTGAACGDLDFYCASSDCESDYCAAPTPCRTTVCPAGQYCDPSSSGCVPGQPAGSTCTTNAECDPSIVCRAGSCGAPLPDQSVCLEDSDCTSGACVPIAGQTSGSECGAPLPDGSPCTGATGCQSGGCNYGSAGAVCGAPVCAGTT